MVASESVGNLWIFQIWHPVEELPLLAAELQNHTNCFLLRIIPKGEGHVATLYPEPWLPASFCKYSTQNYWHLVCIKVYFPSRKCKTESNTKQYIFRQESVKLKATRNNVKIKISPLSQGSQQWRTLLSCVELPAYLHQILSTPSCKVDSSTNQSQPVLMRKVELGVTWRESSRTRLPSNPITSACHNVDKWQVMSHRLRKQTIATYRTGSDRLIYDKNI